MGTTPPTFLDKMGASALTTKGGFGSTPFSAASISFSFSDWLRSAPRLDLDLDMDDLDMDDLDLDTSTFDWLRAPPTDGSPTHSTAADLREES
ncbi:hypothetical protein TRAPUB_13146 [Trametes pubescens]|uniref:Uncharacterized protein n=1 Tax=Trametes pubescens TaxID=154538 RepID=A0A1M2VRW8_TRAPU|nr:hypothetical protein TRAPUB_13146 [Trametes pubescens]